VRNLLAIWKNRLRFSREILEDPAKSQVRHKTKPKRLSEAGAAV